jgi:hypothetical protein
MHVAFVVWLLRKWGRAAMGATCSEGGKNQTP